MADKLSGSYSPDFSLWDYCNESILHGDSQTLHDESKDLQRAMDEDLPLNDVWLSTINFPGYENQVDYYSDTESQAGSSSTAASPAPTTASKFQYIDDEELTSLSVKELNQKLKSCPKNISLAYKQKRRTLKNRGYAKSCRNKRLAEKSNLEVSKDSLEKENIKLRRMLQHVNHQLTVVTQERDFYRNRCLMK